MPNNRKKGQPELPCKAQFKSEWSISVDTSPAEIESAYYMRKDANGICHERTANQNYSEKTIAHPPWWP